MSQTFQRFGSLWFLLCPTLQGLCPKTSGDQNFPPPTLHPETDASSAEAGRAWNFWIKVRVAPFRKTDSIFWGFHYRVGCKQISKWKMNVGRFDQKSIFTRMFSLLWTRYFQETYFPPFSILLYTAQWVWYPHQRIARPNCTGQFLPRIIPKWPQELQSTMRKTQFFLKNEPLTAL